jgi:hypothetical protein
MINGYSKMNFFFKNNWIIILSGLIVLIAILVFLTSDTLDDAAKVGDFLAGFASSLAFLWLIASFKQQQNELKIQREELTLQRKAIELQGQELKNLSKFSALEQVRLIAYSAMEQVKLSDTSTKDHNDFLNVFISKEFFENMEVMFDSTNEVEIASIYKKWVPIEMEMRGFFNKISTASKIYLEQVSDEKIDFAQEDFQFIQNNIEQIKKIPYIAEVANTLVAFGGMFIQYEPFLKKIQLSGVTAMSLGLGKRTHKLFDEYMFEDLKKELDKYGLEYPAIIQRYNNH